MNFNVVIFGSVGFVSLLLVTVLGGWVEKKFSKMYKASDKGRLDHLVDLLIRFSLTANMLSMARLACSIILFIANAVMLLLYGQWMDVRIMAITGIPLAFTDAVDGKIARRTSTSDYGKLLDSIADKVFMIAYSMIFIEWTFIGLLLILSYICYGISAVALWYFKNRIPKSCLADGFAANSFGKIKTLLQFPALALLYCHGLGFSFSLWQIPAALLESALFFEAKSQILKRKMLFASKRAFEERDKFRAVS